MSSELWNKIIATIAILCTVSFFLVFITGNGWFMIPILFTPLLVDLIV